MTSLSELVSMASAKCDGCLQLVLFLNLRTVLRREDGGGYVRLQLCQACRVKA